MSLARLGLRHAARCSPGRGAAAAGALLAPRAPVAARMQLLGPLQHQQPWACVPLVARSSSSDTATSASSVQAAPAAPAAAATASGPPPHLAHPRNQSMFCRMCGGAMQLIQPEGDREWRHVCGACRCGAGRAYTAAASSRNAREACHCAARRTIKRQSIPCCCCITTQLHRLPQPQAGGWLHRRT